MDPDDSQCAPPVAGRTRFSAHTLVNTGLHLKRTVPIRNCSECAALWSMVVVAGEWVGKGCNGSQRNAYEFFLFEIKEIVQKKIWGLLELLMGSIRLSVGCIWCSNGLRCIPMAHAGRRELVEEFSSVHKLGPGDLEFRGL